jgi:hypothetical protein
LFSIFAIVWSTLPSKCFVVILIGHIKVSHASYLQLDSAEANNTDQALQPPSLRRNTFQQQTTDIMSAPIVGVSENTVKDVWSREDLDGILGDNAVGLVSVTPVLHSKA